MHRCHRRPRELASLCREAQSLQWRGTPRGVRSAPAAAGPSGSRSPGQRPAPSRARGVGVTDSRLRGAQPSAVPSCAPATPPACSRPPTAPTAQPVPGCCGTRRPWTSEPARVPAASALTARLCPPSASTVSPRWGSRGPLVQGWGSCRASCLLPEPGLQCPTGPGAGGPAHGRTARQGVVLSGVPPHLFCLVSPAALL